MLDVENSGTIIYPESGSFSSSSNEDNLSRGIDGFNYKDYEYNGSATIALQLYDNEPQEGDLVRAYYNEEIRGIAEGIICPINEKLVFPMMFYGHAQGDELTFKYYDGADEEIDLLETITFVPDMHLNSAIDPYIMTDEHPLTYSLSNAYPNPFNPTTTIEYSIADNINNLNINVYDIRGRLVERIYEGAKDKGEYQIIWNASGFASGVYFVHMIANKHVFTKKVMLIK